MMTMDSICFSSLSFSMQYMSYQPPRPKTACGACLKVSHHISRMSALVCVCGGLALDWPNPKDIV